MKPQPNSEDNPQGFAGCVPALGIMAGTGLLFWFNWFLVPLLFGSLCVLLLCCRFAYWLKEKPAVRRVAAATLLVFYQPRKNHEPRLHAFCYSDHA